MRGRLVPPVRIGAGPGRTSIHAHRLASCANSASSPSSRTTAAPRVPLPRSRTGCACSRPPRPWATAPVGYAAALRALPDQPDDVLRRGGAADPHDRLRHGGARHAVRGPGAPGRGRQHGRPAQRRSGSSSASAGDRRLRADPRPVFGLSERSFREEAETRAARLLEVLQGEPLGSAGKGYESIPAGADLTLQPLSPSSATASGGAAAAWAPRCGRREGAAAALFDAQHGGHRRAVRPGAGGPDRGVPRPLRRTAPRPHGEGRRRPDRRAAARRPRPCGARGVPDRVRVGHGRRRRPLSGTPPFRFSTVLSGQPDAIVEALLADPAVGATDELVITLPANGDAASHERILRIVAEEIAPAVRAAFGSERPRDEAHRGRSGDQASGWARTEVGESSGARPMTISSLIRTGWCTHRSTY